MATGVIAGTYGHALFELGVEENAIDLLLDEAKVVDEILDGNPDFQKLLNHPRVDAEKKIELIENCFAGRVSNHMTGFLTIMVQNDRQKDIRFALADFIAEVKEYRHIGICKVVSALPLTEDQKSRLRDRLIETTDYKAFEMHYQVDEKLIGGLTVQIGDRILDYSIRSQLNDLQKTLRQVSADI